MIKHYFNYKDCSPAVYDIVELCFKSNFRYRCEKCSSVLILDINRLKGLNHKAILNGSLVFNLKSECPVSDSEYKMRNLLK